ncbi:MAG: metalloregulator ArsR/SmtB family transcription factor [Polyangiaceae bacterium]|nr:metalloregulator ArsR/SmtB family transcription factor [Polyangiaceae bacterium]
MNGSFDAVLSWMSALSEPARVRVLRLVEQHELSVAELCQVLQLPQSTTSRHLKHLCDEGWLEPRKDGRNRYYRMRRSQLGSPARKFWKLVREQFDEDASSHEDDARLERVMQERQTQSQAFFASSAGRWDKLRSELFGEHVALTAIGALLQDQVVADLGCGTGQLLELIAPFCEHAFGVDQSAAMIKSARQRLKSLSKVTLLRTSLEELPLEEASLDTALMVLVLHHLPQPTQTLAEALRALRPGGRLIVLDMQAHEREDYRQQMGHIWLGFSAEQLRSWFTEVGFARFTYTPFSPNPNAKGPSLFVGVGYKTASAGASGLGFSKPQSERQRGTLN